MRTQRTGILAALALAVVLTVQSAASAQVVYYTPVVSPPVVVQPSISFYGPAPATYSFYAPATSYYAPAVSYSPPLAVYSPPVAVAPAFYTTRSYVGFGVFRPRGVYTETYATFAPTTTLYRPIFWR